MAAVAPRVFFFTKRWSKWEFLAIFSRFLASTEAFLVIQTAAIKMPKSQHLKVINQPAAKASEKWNGIDFILYRLHTSSRVETAKILFKLFYLIVEEEYRVLDIVQSKDRNKNRKFQTRAPYRNRLPVLPPRTNKMPVDQDWPSVWPVARVFHPASVPLPLYQGWVEPGRTPPGKFANAELMKIPNFLHLTPPAIERHCAALKSSTPIPSVLRKSIFPQTFSFLAEFCTPWPKNLDTDEKIEAHFPLQVITTDYCHSSPTIRDLRARIVTFKVIYTC